MAVELQRSRRMLGADLVDRATLRPPELEWLYATLGDEIVREFSGNRAVTISDSSATKVMKAAGVGEVGGFPPIRKNGGWMGYPASKPGLAKLIRLHDGQVDLAGVVGGMVDALSGFLVVLRLGPEYVLDVGLRIAVVEGEPG
jgi:hypothetical protein